MEIFNSFYIGIVVQNNDPEYRGRIKVWVPSVNATVYNKWNQVKLDRKFKFPGTAGGVDASDLSLIIEELKDDLPWAEYCGSIVGEVASGVYNSNTDTSTVSDASFNYTLKNSNTTTTADSYKLNNDGIGEKPGSVYEKYGAKLVDAFTDTANVKANQVNQNGTQYTPSTYSNAAKGLFAVPNVGAHVWVMFMEGITAYPVYFGASFGAEDFNSIFNTEEDTRQDYPQSYESIKSKGSINVDGVLPVYRNKMVLNQRGAAIEIINTTDRERFKVTHFAGGFLELNNKFNSIFSPKNLQFLTLKDKFETVRGHNNSFVGRDYDSIIQGNHFIKVGNLDKSAMQDWIDAYTPIADLLALPDSDSSKSSITQKIIDQSEALAKAEAKLGFGGNSIETITKHKVLAIGLLFNQFDSYRVIAGNKAVSSAANITSSVVETSITNIDRIDYTHIDDQPGGNYTVTIANKYKTLVGSGGYSLNTTGPITVDGAIVKTSGTQVNIASKEDFNIDGGTNLSVIADIIAIRTRDKTQVLLDDNLGISKNVIIGGGTYTNGEVYLQHVTAPVEFQVTESTTISDTTYTITGATISKAGGGIISSGNIVNISGGTLAINQPHTHYFKNLPLTLVADAATVRTAATALNGGSAAATATAVINGYNTAGGQKNVNPNGPGPDSAPGTGVPSSATQKP